MNAFLNRSTEAGRSDGRRTFHVAFCVDNHYFRSMGATIASLIAHNPDTHFVFHVFAFAVADEHRTRLGALEEKFGAGTHIHLIDPSVFREFARFTESSYYSPAIFSRLLIPTLLRDVTDRVLYLDADILCVASLAELMDLDIDDTVAAVVPDAEATARRRCAALGLEYPYYFNSGVMYMNVGRWMDNRITERTIDALMKDGKDYRFPDQDALNVVLAGCARFIDRKWNYLYGLVGDLENDRRQMQLTGDAALIHFAGAVKPWSNWTLHESRELFARHHAMSTWADLPMDETPKNYKEMRMHSRFLWRRRQIAESLYWYWQYARAKFRF